MLDLIVTSENIEEILNTLKDSYKNVENKTISEINIKFRDNVLSGDKKLKFLHLLCQIANTSSSIQINLNFSTRKIAENYNLSQNIFMVGYNNVNLSFQDFDKKYIYKINEWQEEQDIINDFVKEIDTLNFTPFEKYLAAYNFVKKFKKYKDVPRDKEMSNFTSSRDIKYILNNEYMVCAGYVNLLSNILSKLQINNMMLNCTVGSGKSLGLHERILVYIKDENYGIDNYFIADPTWDNDKDTLTYLANNINQKSKTKITYQSLPYYFFEQNIPYFEQIKNKIEESSNKIHTAQIILISIEKFLIYFEKPHYGMLDYALNKLSKSKSLDDYYEFFKSFCNDFIKDRFNFNFDAEKIINCNNNLKYKLNNKNIDKFCSTITLDELIENHNNNFEEDSIINTK